MKILLRREERKQKKGVTTMKEKILTLSEAQQEMINLPRQLVPGKRKVIVVTCEGNPRLAIVSYETYQKLLATIEELQETLALCQDPEQMATLRNSLAELELDQGKEK